MEGSAGTSTERGATSHRPAGKTAAQTPRGRPFRPGDERINRGGRPKQLLTRAIAATLSEADAAAIVRAVIDQAKAGDLDAVRLLWDRLEGRPIARQEQGDPGSFDQDLADVPTAALKAALRRVT